ARKVQCHRTVFTAEVDGDVPGNDEAGEDGDGFVHDGERVLSRRRERQVGGIAGNRQVAGGIHGVRDRGRAAPVLELFEARTPVELASHTTSRGIMRVMRAGWVSDITEKSTHVMNSRLHDFDVGTGKKCRAIPGCGKWARAACCRSPVAWVK